MLWAYADDRTPSGAQQADAAGMPLGAPWAAVAMAHTWPNRHSKPLIYFCYKPIAYQMHGAEASQGLQGRPKGIEDRAMQSAVGTPVGSEGGAGRLYWHL